MLPFLKNKQEASVSAPVAHKELSTSQDSEYDMLEAAAMDLIISVHLKDVKAVCSALRAAFEIMESQPHHEGEHF